jgi:hypothetical protein
VTEDEDLDLEEWAVQRAMFGLRASYMRCRAGYGYSIPLPELVAVPAVDFANWACALDEQFRKTDTNYVARRSADDEGRLLAGLRFVRDRHMHQVAITSAVQAVVTYPDYSGGIPPTITPAMTSVRVYWLPVGEIREPTDWRRNEDWYRNRRDAYQEHLEGRDVRMTLLAALRFLSCEVEARGIERSVVADLEALDIPDYK